MEGSGALQAKLSRLRRLLRAALAAGGLGRFLCVAAVALTVHFVLDRLFQLPTGARAALLGVVGGILLWRFGRDVVFPLLRSMPDEALAMEVERRRGEPDDLLASAVAFRSGAAGAGSAGLRELALSRAENLAPAVPVERLVRWEGPLRWLGTGLLLALLLAAAALLQPESTRTWFRRGVLLADVEWPRRTFLSMQGFTDGVRYVARGSDAEVCVRASGVVPRVARLEVRPAEESTPGTIAMQEVDYGVFCATVEQVSQSLRLRARGGDGRTAENRLEVVDRPEVADASVEVQPPDYLGPEAVRLRWNAPKLRVPTGSRVTVELESTRPLSTAEWSLGGKEPRPMRRRGPRSVLFSFQVRSDVSCRLSLRDRHDIDMKPPLGMHFRAVPDRSPVVQLRAEGIGSMVVPSARLPLRLEAEDDYLVTAAGLEFRYEPGGGKGESWNTALELKEPDRRFQAEPVVDLRTRNLQARGGLVVTATARDNCGLDGPNVGRSVPLDLRLVTAGEFLRGLLARQEDLRRDLEGHLETQRRIAGRSRKALSEGAEEELRRAGRQESLLVEELSRIAAAYRFLLRQMRNNRTLGDAAYMERTGEIVRPLEKLSAPGGPLMKAAEDIQRAQRSAVGGMEAAARTMEKVRDRMMLLEGFAAVAASVEEIAEDQAELLRETEKGWKPFAGEEVGK